MGDVVLSTPVVRALKKAYPKAEIDLMVIPQTREIAQYIPSLNQIIVYDKEDKHRKLKEFLKLRSFLRSRHYDLAITASNSTRSALITWVSGARYRIGSPNQGGFLFLTHPVREDSVPMHLSEIFLQYLRPLGIHGSDSSLELQIDPHNIQKVQQKLVHNPDRPLIAICPFGNCRPQKSWTIENCSELVKLLAPMADLYLIGGKAEQSRLEKINSLSGGLAMVWAGNLSMGELIAFVKLLDLLVTVDTGPMHIAGAVGTKIVALFGPTEPTSCGPRGKDDVVIRHYPGCEPCRKPIECDRCMRDIQAEEVYSEVLKLIPRP